DRTDAGDRRAKGNRRAAVGYYFAVFVRGGGADRLRRTDRDDVRLGCLAHGASRHAEPSSDGPAVGRGARDWGQCRNCRIFWHLAGEQGRKAGPRGSVEIRIAAGPGRFGGALSARPGRTRAKSDLFFERASIKVLQRSAVAPEKAGLQVDEAAL